MKFNAILKNDRDIYHDDPRVKKLVDLLLYDDTDLYHEIVDILQSTSNFDSFKEQLYNLFNLYKLNENYDKLQIYITFLWHIYNDETNCSNLRGALLEKLVCKLLDEKYKSDYESFISCYVSINSWKSAKTVDVFLYLTSGEMGESIECKVKPFNIEIEHIDNLKSIYNKSDRKLVPSIITFSSRKALELKVKDLKIPLGPIQLFGGDNLKEITNKNFIC